MESRSQCGCQFPPSKLSIWTSNLWRLLGSILVLSSLLPSGVSQSQPSTIGFISINCGGDKLTDKDTQLEWVNDTQSKIGFLDSGIQLVEEGVAIRARVQLNDSDPSPRVNAEQLKTAMVFIPDEGTSARSKYCYNFNITLSNNDSTNYLIRAMFPSKKLTPMNDTTSTSGHRLSKYSTRFYFTVDSTYISTIELKEWEPQLIELVVSSLDDIMYICLVPLEDRSSMPAISSLELRPLPQNFYPIWTSNNRNLNPDRAGKETEYFMTLWRVTFGRDESLPALRYPQDEFDRLWYGMQIPDSMLRQVKSKRDTNLQVSVDKVSDYESFRTPNAVMASAWEAVDMESEINFTINIGDARSIRQFQQFSVSVNLIDFDPSEDNDTGRFVRIYNEDLNATGHMIAGGFYKLNATVPSHFTWDTVQYFMAYSFFADFSVFQVRATPDSTRPAMINAFDLYGKFEAVSQRTNESDVSTIEAFSGHWQVANQLDTAGGPCLPVPWNWLVCSLEAPPRITQINVTSRGIKAEIPADLTSLDRLTVLDLSNNSFSGSLPLNLVDIPTLRVLDVADNHLSGVLPSFGEKSLQNLQTLSLRNNNFTGNLSSLVKALHTPVYRIDLSVNQFSQTIPKEIVNLVNLRSVNFSYNRLSGLLDIKLLQLPQLQILSLENNTLNGTVSNIIWESSHSQLQTVYLNNNSFTELNLSAWSQNLVAKSYGAQQQQVFLLHNDIDNVILPWKDQIDRLSKQSQSRLERSTGFILLGGNPYCKNKYDDASLTVRYLCRYNPLDSFVAERGPRKTTLIISLAITGIMVVLLSSVLIIFLGRMLKRMKDLRQIQEVLAKEDVRPPFYKYEDLKMATKNFSQEMELGKGAFGAVYKADLPDQGIVAVKLLFPTKQNLDEFLKEMVLITGIKHRHLIQLKGCCVRDKKRMLVYEYAEKGNLAQALWSINKSTVLTWAQRLSICMGIAKGLSYLHEELQPKIIHRDIKPQNILLDKEWNAKIADFGLARPMDENSTHLERATSIGGTLGYFSPEYATQGFLTEKLDVYSYGILVLEIVSGRRCIDSSLSQEEIYLKNLAFKLYKEDCITRIAEKCILTIVPKGEIESVLKIALLCLQEDHEKRPSMSQVVNMLTGNISDVALDIVNELKDKQLMYESLFDAQTDTIYDEKLERDDRALLSSTSYSNPRQFIELSVTNAR